MTCAGTPRPIPSSGALPLPLCCGTRSGRAQSCSLWTSRCVAYLYCECVCIMCTCVLCLNTLVYVYMSYHMLIPVCVCHITIYEWTMWSYTAEMTCLSWHCGIGWWCRVYQSVSGVSSLRPVQDIDLLLLLHCCFTSACVHLWWPCSKGTSGICASLTTRTESSLMKCPSPTHLTPQACRIQMQTLCLSTSGWVAGCRREMCIRY